MKAYLPYISIAVVCVLAWVIINFGIGLLPSYSLPAIETLPLPDRIVEIELREKKPSLPIRLNAFLSRRESISQAGSVSRGLNKKVIRKNAIQKRFALQAIVVDGERRFASIDGYSIVGEGDSLGEYTVIAIGADTVRLKGPKGEEVLVFQDVQKGGRER